MRSCWDRWDHREPREKRFITNSLFWISSWSSGQCTQVRKPGSTYCSLCFTLRTKNVRLKRTQEMRFRSFKSKSLCLPTKQEVHCTVRHVSTDSTDQTVAVKNHRKALMNKSCSVRVTPSLCMF